MSRDRVRSKPPAGPFSASGPLTLGPTLASLYLSFTSFDLLQPPRWIGLANYERMAFDDPRLGKALAELEIRLLAVGLLNQVTLELEGDQDLTLRVIPSPSPADGLVVRAHCRAS